jgi:hypothetical protein
MNSQRHKFFQYPEVMAKGIIIIIKRNKVIVNFLARKADILTGFQEVVTIAVKKSYPCNRPWRL